MQATNKLNNHNIVDTSKNLGLPNISDPISDFAQPLYDSSWDAEDIDAIYDLTCCCWNIGTCSEKHTDFLWDLLIQDKLDEDFNDPAGILADKLRNIIEQRRTQFADDRRFILDFWLNFTGHNRMDLKIASTSLPEKDFLALQMAKALPVEQ